MSPSHPLHPGLKKTVSPSLQFNLPPASHGESRCQRSFRSTSSAVYSPSGNSRILIEIPKIDGVCINGNASQLLGVFRSAGTGVMYSNSLNSWIRRLTIRGSDNSVLEDLQSYNVLHRIISDLTTPKDQQDNLLSLTAGYGSDVDRAAFAVNKSFCLTLMSSFFRNSNLIPLGVVGPLQIELELEDDANVLQTSDGTPATYAISDVRMSLELVSFSDAINAAIISAHKQGKVSLHCPSYQQHSLSSFAQNEVFSVTNNSRSVKQLVFILRKASNIRNWAKDSLGERTIGSLQSISVQIGNQVIDALNTPSEMWISTLRAFYYQVSGCVSQRNYATLFGGTGTSFVIAFSLESDEGSGFISGNHSGAAIEIKMVHGSAIAPDIIQYDAFVLCDRVITFLPTGPVVTQ
jgi:hypothetical protein